MIYFLAHRIRGTKDHAQRDERDEAKQKKTRIFVLHLSLAHRLQARLAFFVWFSVFFFSCLHLFVK